VWVFCVVGCGVVLVWLYCEWGELFYRLVGVTVLLVLLELGVGCFGFFLFLLIFGFVCVLW